MPKRLVGKIVFTSQLPLSKSIRISMKISEPISIGDKLTFDGWQEGLVYKVDKIEQKRKQVTSAVPGIAAITVPSYVALGSNAYKVVDDEAQPQPAGSAVQGAASAPQQPQKAAAGAIPLAFGAATVAAGQAQNQGQAPSMDSQQPQQKVSAVSVPTFSRGGFFKKAIYAGAEFSQSTMGNATIQQTNLNATNTEFLQYAPKYTTQIKAKSMSYIIWYLIIVMILVLPLIIIAQIYHNSKLPPSLLLITLFIELLISGGILLYIGFKKFSLEQLLSSMPVAKIDVATYNLNKMQGKFIPYKEQPLKAPISGADCIYYSIGVYAVFWERYGNNKHIVVEPVGFIGMGVPALFTDNSGYLAVDMEKAPNLEVISESFEINKEGIGAAAVRMLSGQLAYIEQGRQLAGELLPKITEVANNNTKVDLSQISGFKFKPYFTNRIRDLKGKLTNDFHLGMMQNFAFFLLEQYIPTNSDYTCLGSAASIGKDIENKPVKVLVPEQQRGTMAVKVGTAQNANKSISKHTVINLALGILFVIAAFYVLSVYFGMPSATSANVIAPVTATTALPSQPSTGQQTTAVPQPAGALSAQGSCNGFSISEVAFVSKKSSTCSWSGGSVAISAGSGNSGYVSVEIIGADGKAYFNKGTVDWCPAQIGNVYLPPQNYTITIKSGKGGGNCNSSPKAVVSISAS